MTVSIRHTYLVGKLLELSKSDVECYMSDWYHDAITIEDLPDKPTKPIKLSYGWRDSGTSLYVELEELDCLKAETIKSYHASINDYHVVHITIKPDERMSKGYVTMLFELI